MAKWHGRIGRAALMGLIWAVGWVPVGVLAGLIVDPDNSMDEMWGAIGAYPGFLCALVAFALSGIATGRRSVRELSLSRAGALGAMAGAIVATPPSILVTAETADSISGWLPGTLLLGSVVLLSTVSAVFSLALIRWRSRSKAARPFQS